MFYLLSFLTLLMGILIYSMDPVPMRQELDTRQGEAYIVGFVNQHQAAKDYIYHWLGRVRVGEMKGPPDSTHHVGFDDEQRVKVGSDVVAMGLFPDDLEAFMPRMMASEIRRYSGINKSAVSMTVANEDTPPPGSNYPGSYKSVAVSFVSGNLGPFYTCNADCTSDAVTKIVDKSSDRYIITYGRPQTSDGEFNVNPGWWGELSNTPAQKKELWRRALTNRIRNSVNCGVLLVSKEEKRWIATNQLKGDQVTEADGNPRNYCFDNGQRCTSVLFPEMQEFLEKYAYDCGSPAREDCLDGTFLCMSRMENSYITGGLLLHFDAIDTTGFGAPWDAESFVKGNIPLPPWQDRTSNWKEIPADKMAYSTKLGYQVKTAFSSKTIHNDFVKKSILNAGSDFTLSFVMRRTGNGHGCIIGNCDKTHGFYFRATDDKHFVFGLGGGKEISTDDTSFNAVLAEESLFEDGVHMWTIVQKNKKMTFYLDAQPLNADSNIHDAYDWTSTNNGEAMVFNPVENTYFLNLLYYNRALDLWEIMSNFRADAKRFGIAKNIEVGTPVEPNAGP